MLVFSLLVLVIVAPVGQTSVALLSGGQVWYEGGDENDVNHHGIIFRVLFELDVSATFALADDSKATFALVD